MKVIDSDAHVIENESTWDYMLESERQFKPRVVGATSAKGDEPSVRPLTPNDLLATWYHALGIDLKTAFLDLAGRPTPILPHGKPIDELI